MPPLQSGLRSLLESTVVSARDAAENAARAALLPFGVEQEHPLRPLAPPELELRDRLIAKAHQLGSYARLVEECAYEHWHRMLFARFLAENDLLMHPSGVPVTLQECAELAAEEGEPDPWALAAEYAGAMLPGIFRREDPVLEMRFPPEGRQRLESLLESLPPAVFTASDSLGWVYQFWQTKRKEEVNRSERKVGGDDLPPVTQLFTEHYMVQFLLHNSLGAWWAAGHPGEALPTSTDYLRRLEDGAPAAGSFPGWPRTARELRILDPCCGSGHFLVAAFTLMVRFRMAEEGMDARAAGDAVLRDNLFALELDPRCTQIAAFALALAAWQHGGYRALPPLNVACSGLPVGCRLVDWLQPAGGDRNLEAALRALYRLFQQAPTLGSLIDPVRDAADVWVLPTGPQQPLLDLPGVEWPKARASSSGVQTSMDGNLFALAPEEVLPALNKALARETTQRRPSAVVFGVAAQGAARAAELLAGKYHLVITNVPYLARGKQDETLQRFCGERYPYAKSDLATVFLERCREFTSPGGTYALVMPQNWLFLGSYRKLRESLLKGQLWNIVVRLGPAAFEDMNWWAANTMLLVAGNAIPQDDSRISGIDVSAPRVPAEKARLLRSSAVHVIGQGTQLRNPDARLVLGDMAQGSLLDGYASGVVGVQTADYPRFGRCFWELPGRTEDWEMQQSTVDASRPFGGREHIIWWEGWSGELRRRHDAGHAYVRGKVAWGKPGVAVSSMYQLPVTLYTGELFDNNVAVILPHDPAHLPAIWAFCQSTEFVAAVRRIDQSVKVTNATLVKVPFDLERWQKVADDAGPLPEPRSDDPTQWLFEGHPAGSTDPLQVALGRLLGYRWPGQKAPDGLEAYADQDGIVCLPSVGGETPAADRLCALLAAAYGAEWSPARLEQLLADAGYGGQSLEVWLRDGLFAAHCRIFHNRPFLWHVWDGRRDGFSALVNYHRLDRANLQKLTYTYVGDWMSRQDADARRGESGAGQRLAAAGQLQAKLGAILEGEPPHDIYVRWKPLEQQPIGWEPDLNDGVRLNIRPFVAAGVLRSRFTIHWNKDRGRDSDGSERINDRHFTRAEKEAACREQGMEP